MGSINISIREEAYEFLKSLKTKDRSFSDIILGFKPGDDIMSFFGALKDAEWEKKELAMNSLRQSFKKRLA